MKSIPKTEFIRLLSAYPSAKVDCFYFDGIFTPTDGWVKEQAAKVEKLTFRMVKHKQTNALMFDNNSWLMFNKPKNCDSRKTYRVDADGEVFGLMVDHRPAYTNPFGTPIKEQTTILLYKIGV